MSNVDKHAVDGQPPVRLCNYTDVYYRDAISADQEFMAATASPDQAATFGLKPGDVLITKDSETADDIGVPAYVDSSAPDLVCGYHLAILRPTPSIDGRFLYWVAASTFAREQLEMAATGVTRFGLRTDAIEQLAVPDPCMSRQRAIADFLDAETARIDALIAKKRQLAQLALSRLRARMESLLADLDADLVPLGRFVTSISQGTSPQASAHPAEQDELGLLKLSAVKDGAFHATENKALPADFTGQRVAPREGDLLVTRSNTPLLVGDVCTVDKDYPTLVLPDLIYRLRLSDGLMPRFATLCLRASQSRGILSSLARGTSQTMVKLRGEDIKSVPIPAVSLDVQSRLVATTGQLRFRQEALTRRLDRQIDLLRERRQALITAAVTGELPIPGAAA